jgi:hypothetical protein
MPNSLYEAARRRMGELRNAFSSQSMARNPILGQMDPRDMAHGLSATQPMPPAAANALVGFVPGIGDAIGLGQDVANYAADPGSRNWLNYGLSAAALIPGVPRMPKRKYPMAPEGSWYGEGTYKADGGRIVEMSPDEYINRVRPLEIDESSRENIDLLKKHIEDGGELDPLLIRANGKEDGRHRAYAAKELGIGKVPVIVYDK